MWRVTRSPLSNRSADVCLVPLRAVPLFRSFVPSKMFEILACGRPIVASLEGEAAEILQASGAAIVVPPEDVDALAEAVRRLVADPSLQRELAGRGRPYVAHHYDRCALASRYLMILEGCPGRRARCTRVAQLQGVLLTERSGHPNKVLRVLGARFNLIKAAPADLGPNQNTKRRGRKTLTSLSCPGRGNRDEAVRMWERLSRPPQVTRTDFR